MPGGTGLVHSPLLLSDDEGLAEESAKTHMSAFPQGAAGCSLVDVC